LLRKLSDNADAGDKEAASKRDKVLELYKHSLLGKRICLTESNALLGYAPSQADLGLAYMRGRSVVQDKAKAVEWLRKAVDQGEYRAMLWLGTAYERGDGVAKDDWRAFDLWRRSHELGWDPATEKLHSLSDEYRKEAEKGNASAQFFLGVAHEYGYAGKPDAAKAVEWYRKAAERGHPGAQTFLGFALLTGSGVAKAPEQAVMWFRKAAEKGNPEAQQNLGRCLFLGDGCKKNQQEAVTWYRKAAEQGEAGAMFNLGACYMEGTGVKKDVAEATKWFKRAAALGHERSANMLEKLQKDSAR
jgi:TPR repeat protein